MEEASDNTHIWGKAILVLILDHGWLMDAFIYGRYFKKRFSQNFYASKGRNSCFGALIIHKSNFHGVPIYIIGHRMAFQLLYFFSYFFSSSLKGGCRAWAGWAYFSGLILQKVALHDLLLVNICLGSIVIGTADQIRSWWFMGYITGKIEWMDERMDGWEEGIE